MRQGNCSRCRVITKANVEMRGRERDRLCDEKRRRRKAGKEGCRRVRERVSSKQEARTDDQEKKQEKRASRGETSERGWRGG